MIVFKWLWAAVLIVWWIVIGTLRYVFARQKWTWGEVLLLIVILNLDDKYDYDFYGFVGRMMLGLMILSVVKAILEDVRLPGEADAETKKVQDAIKLLKEFDAKKDEKKPGPKHEPEAILDKFKIK